MWYAIFKERQMKDYQKKNALDTTRKRKERKVKKKVSVQKASEYRRLSDN